MASLYLIRHGQASFGEADYDQLSHKGKQQGEILGKAWQSMPTPDVVFTGELCRHRQTYAAFNQALENTNRQSPIVHELANLNEFDHIDILLNSQTKKQWQSYPDLVDYLLSLPNAKENLNRVFDDAFSEWMQANGVQDKGVQANASTNYQESWQAFQQRANYALQQMIDMRQAEQNTLLAFTSGGIIAAIVQQLLSLTDQHCLALMKQIRNTSVTKVVFSDQRISLDYFNNYQHLEIVGEHWSTHR